MDIFKGKTNSVPVSRESVNTSTSPAPLKSDIEGTQSPQAPPLRSINEGSQEQTSQNWTRLVGGSQSSDLESYLIDMNAPTSKEFRPIHVPDLFRDIYSRFSKDRQRDIPHRAIILKYDAMIKTFKGMITDMKMILKGGRLKPREAPAVLERIEQLKNAVVKAEYNKALAETEWNRTIDAEVAEATRQTTPA